MNDIPQRKYSRFDDSKTFDYIGNGELGGKAAGLVQIQEIFEAEILDNEFENLNIAIPKMTVLRTDVFDEFMKQNDLYPIALSAIDDVFIAQAFQKASLPPIFLGDLRNLISKADTPLAIRSSSLLEDSSEEPFAGVYATKMLPNNQPDTENRFKKLIEAIKFIYSSLFFAESRDYFQVTGKDLRDEKMAVIIQDVVGNRYGDHFYPLISGVARSYNYYPVQNCKREDGVVNLALGLGKTIVDGGSSWLYCPLMPQSPPPYNNIKDLLDNSQRDFWTVKMGRINEFNPISEVEFMEKHDLDKAEEDGVLNLTCSTYDYMNDVLIAGVQGAGARLLNFAPVLKYEKIFLNKAIRKLLDICSKQYCSDVEIEFAVRKDDTSNQYNLGFLQVRTMKVASDDGTSETFDYQQSDLLAESHSVLGNGKRNDILDIVYVKPDTFSAINSRNIAREIAAVNRELAEQNKPYLLIGFGRWGSSDPWLGIPVTWSMISAARTIIEATLPQMKPDLSQGSHFFHNLIAFGIFYLSIEEEKKKTIDWNWLDRQEIIHDGEFVRHVRCSKNISIIVDCVKNRGVIVK
jgi:hypothetical protein